MKKIYSFMLAALAICAVSCQEGPIDTQEPEVPQAGETMTFTATFDGDTKVALGEDGLTPYWENNDAITIYAAEGAKAVFRTTLPEGEKASTATFQYDRGLNGNNDCPALNPPYYAVYGKQDQRSVIVDDVVDYVMIYKDQNVDDHYSAPMMAWSETATLKFQNAAALLKFKVNADNVQSVRIEADADIAGDSACDKDANLSFRQGHWTSKEVILRGDFVKGQTYYIAVVPTTINSLKMYVNGAEFKSVNKTLSLYKSNIYNLGTIEQVDVTQFELTVQLYDAKYNKSIDQVEIKYKGGESWGKNMESYNQDNASTWIIIRPYDDLNKDIELIFSSSTQKQWSNSVFASATAEKLVFKIESEQRDWWQGWNPILLTSNN